MWHECVVFPVTVGAESSLRQKTVQITNVDFLADVIHATIYVVRFEFNGIHTRNLEFNGSTRDGFICELP